LQIKTQNIIFVGKSNWPYVTLLTFILSLNKKTPSGFHILVYYVINKFFLTDFLFIMFNRTRQVGKDSLKKKNKNSTPAPATVHGCLHLINLFEYKTIEKKKNYFSTLNQKLLHFILFFLNCIYLQPHHIQGHWVFCSPKQNHKQKFKLFYFKATREIFFNDVQKN
jgi:hypothetical protein